MTDSIRDTQQLPISAERLMTEDELDAALNSVFADIFDKSDKGALSFACEAEKRGIVASNYQGTAGATAFVLAIILASCGWPT